jgi:hypothetical protein
VPKEFRGFSRNAAEVEANSGKIPTSAEFKKILLRLDTLHVSSQHRPISLAICELSPIVSFYLCELCTPKQSHFAWLIWFETHNIRPYVWLIKSCELSDKQDIENFLNDV